MNKTNPNKRPATMADVNRAKKASAGRCYKRDSCNIFHGVM